MSDGNTKAILELPIAHRDGRTLYHGAEWAALENIVVVTDKNGAQWMRGKDHKRYGITRIYSNNSAAFTRLVSGRQ